MASLLSAINGSESVWSIVHGAAELGPPALCPLITLHRRPPPPTTTGPCMYTRQEAVIFLFFFIVLSTTDYTILLPTGKSLLCLFVSHDLNNSHRRTCNTDMTQTDYTREHKELILSSYTRSFVCRLSYLKLKHIYFLCENKKIKCKRKNNNYINTFDYYYNLT